MHFSGCSASCAQPQIADIGFRGEVAHVGSHLSEAVDIGMGGSLGSEPGFIDWIEHARRYQTERRADEPFFNWARRVPNEDLRRTLGEEGTGTPVTLATKRTPSAKKAPATKKASATRKAPRTKKAPTATTTKSKTKAQAPGSTRANRRVR